jgi:hypothetical protein
MSIVYSHAIARVTGTSRRQAATFAIAAENMTLVNTWKAASFVGMRAQFPSRCDAIPRRKLSHPICASEPERSSIAAVIEHLCNAVTAFVLASVDGYLYT